jgi:hypothetical protein
LLVGLALKIAKNQRNTVSLGELLEFLIKGDDEVALGGKRKLDSGPASGGFRFARPPPRLVGAGRRFGRTPQDLGNAVYEVATEDLMVGVAAEVGAK